MDVNDIWLAEEFQSRKKRNSKYSIRAFSRDLKVSPSFLSRVFNNDLRLTLSSAEKILQCVNFDQNKKEEIIDFYSAELKRNNEVKERLNKVLASPNENNNEIKYLNSKEIYEIIDWKATYLYQLIQNIPENTVQIEEQIEWLSENFSIGKEIILELIEKFKDLDLLHIEEGLKCKYKSFNYNGQVVDVGNDELRECFARSSKDIFLQNTSENTISNFWSLNHSSPEISFAFHNLVTNYYDELSSLSSSSNEKQDKKIYCFCLGYTSMSFTGVL